MQKWKNALAVICFIALFVACGSFLRYILVDDSGSYTRVMMHEMYEQEENIDILFVGSSHCYRSLDPRITDEMFGANTFNVGTSSQQIDGSLALLREVAKTNDLDQVYLEVYYEISQMPAFEERTDMVSTYIVSDYMRPSFHKLGYLLNASSKEHYSNSFILARRNWDKMFEPGYVDSVLKAKDAEWYKEYAYPFSEFERYEGKGYVAVNQVGNTYALEHFTPIETATVSEDYINTLQEIIDFCEKEEIKLTLFSTPMPEFRLVDVGNYDSYIQFMNGLLEGTEVEYYDFNLCKGEYLSFDEDDYADTDHINAKGAEAFSQLFAEFFTGQIPEEDLFYDSYAERLQAQEEDVYGVIAEYQEDGSCTLAPVTNGNEEDITYTINWLPEGGEAVVLQEQDANPTFTLPEGVNGSVEIIFYMDETEVHRVTMPRM